MFHKNEGKMKKLLLSVIALCGVMSASAQRFPTETVRPWLDETKGGLKEARYFGEWGAWMDESFNVVRDAEKNSVSLEHISEGEVVDKETWLSCTMHGQSNIAGQCLLSYALSQWA